ncbi:MAG: 4Fe-4S dicluster domain-containing protein [Thermincola sp.]|jgi:nitrate reductase beta subunit|nr:4Fe-4S dicluster domain-containing protein [Thermincola sp.]
MTKVKNWQLNREVEYPYAEPAEKRDYQWAMVFNPNRCIGCQTCTMACKSTWTQGEGQEQMWWNNVETKPFGGFPVGWDFNLLQELPNGKTIFEAAPSGERVFGYQPDEREYDYPNIYEDVPAGEYPVAESDANGFVSKVDAVETDPDRDIPQRVWFFYLQRVCNHCSYPACLAACPRKAIYKREEDGIVLIDQKRCRGYRECVKACPYKKPFFNSATKVSEKCIGCYPRIEQGLVTRCVAACVGKIRLYGNINDPEGPLHYLVHEEKVALPLYPQFGTQPNVYYIPPRWAPLEFLAQMFGNGDKNKVRETIQKYVHPSPKLLATLGLFGTTNEIIKKIEYASDFSWAEGITEQGKRVRVPVEEPLEIRQGDFSNEP